MRYWDIGFCIWINKPLIEVFSSRLPLVFSTSCPALQNRHASHIDQNNRSISSKTVQSFHYSYPWELLETYKWRTNIWTYNMPIITIRNKHNSILNSSNSVFLKFWTDWYDEKTKSIIVTSYLFCMLVCCWSCFSIRHPSSYFEHNQKS